jgi:nucleoside phosphorylase
MTSMLIDNKPDAVFIVGGCAGLQPGQRIGDVVISSEVLAYESAPTSNDIHHSRPRVSVTPMMLQRLAHQLVDEGRLGRVHVGPLASVSSAMTMGDVSVLQTVSRSVMALDVGSAGAVQSAAAISQEVPVVVVSVINNLVNQEINERVDVAYNAASVVLEMISHLKVLARAKRRSLSIE